LKKAAKLKRESPEGLVAWRNLFGYRLFLELGRSEAQPLLFLDGDRFIPERHLVMSLLKPGMTIVDVGANIGYYVLMFEKKVGKQGRIICFEPEPDNLRELNRNISENNFKNVTVHEFVLGNTEGTVNFQGGITGKVSKTGEYEIPIARLSSIIDEKVDLIKIDVDGFEGAVLYGAEEVIEKYRPVLFLEVHRLRQLLPEYSYNEILKLLNTYYDRLEFYEIERRPNLLRKISIRYLGGNAVREIKDIDHLIQSCLSGERDDTFWIVCSANSETI
jgi:FkbM family methyltransferase